LTKSEVQDLKEETIMNRDSKAVKATILIGTFGAIVGVGFVAYAVVAGDSSAAAAPDRGIPVLAAKTEDEVRLEAKGDAIRQRHKSGKGLDATPIGNGLAYDEQGRLIGVQVDRSAAIPRNRAFDDIAGQAGQAAEVDQSAGAFADELEALNEQIELETGVDTERPETKRVPAARSAALSRPATVYVGSQDEMGTQEPQVDRRELTRSMLAFSTAQSASWAERRPTGGQAAIGARQPQSVEERMLDGMQNMIDKASVAQNVAMASSRGSDGEGYGDGEGELEAGASGMGDDLYPAERGPLPTGDGEIGDMRIAAGPGFVVREGKFLDCALVNRLKADLVESPVVAQVSRDFLNHDGTAVLIPAGAKIIGRAGRVGNVQQGRVYIAFERVIFPDQRAVYFPKRQIGVDGLGSAGVEGEVDRHFWLQFGSAIMLGVLDGLAGATQNWAAVPQPRIGDMVVGRTSQNFSRIMGKIVGRYANVVPTVTVHPGSKMKIFFSQDVRLSPYRQTHAWQ
jgi:type IV secretory pathway VirB10-like protein